ncbi:MAG: hypothetical protein KC609_24905 [Myxococcales bacterium]|nr:hypothetical protein [Myxococcales bacterium]
MKQIRAMLLALALLLTALSGTAMASLCFNCASGSPCNQCRSRSGKDTFADRKQCREMGCKITGYSSCSTASNVKVCRVPETPQPRASVEETLCRVR